MTKGQIALTIADIELIGGAYMLWSPTVAGALAFGLGMFTYLLLIFLKIR